MTMFTPGDRSEKIGVTLDTLVTSESWGEIWRATHDKLSRVLVVAYKREEGKNLFLAAREGFDTWKRLAQSGKPGLLKIHKIVSSGKIPMLVVEDPGGETAREFFSSDAATLKKTARMVRDCCRTLRALGSEHLLPLGITPDTIIRKEGDKDYPSYLIPVSPGVFGDAVRLGEGRYISPDALLLGDCENVNADVYSLAWIWAELLARNHEIDHHSSRLSGTVHYPRLREIIQKALVFRNDQFLDPKKLEFEADQWLENDAAADREAYELWAEKKKSERRKRRRARRKKERAAGSPEAPEASPVSRDAPDREDGPSDDFDEDRSPNQGDDEDELAFARDIPPLAEPSPLGPGPGGGAEKPDPKRAAGAASPRPQRDTSSSFFPLLLTGCFVFVIISAFSAGLWILLAGGDRESVPIRVAGTVGQTGEESPVADTGMESADADAAAPTAPETPAFVAVTPAPSPAPVSETVPEASPTPGPRADSVEALIAAFERANRDRDIQAIRALYYEIREFEAVEGILTTLTAENGELATLEFVERSVPASNGSAVHGVGMLRVSTTAFNLEIPVGREEDRYFLTSVGRVGESRPPVSTPEPAEEPLEFAAWTRGAWPRSVPDRRILRIGLGEETRAVVVLGRSGQGDDEFELRATLSNPLSEKIYYGFVMQVTDADDRLIAVGAGGGALEPGTSQIGHTGEFYSGDDILASAASYEARWYESRVPLGLVGARVVKNPRIPVGFGRGYEFQMGDEAQVEGRIYTEYINNQKVIAAPVLFRNENGPPLYAICSLAFYDANGRLVSGRSQRARVEPSSVKAFDNLICSLPQAAYGEVTSFQAVMLVDGKVLARTEATLPVGDQGEELIAGASPPVEPGPNATPTPLPASSASEATDYRSPDEYMSLEEELAMMSSERTPTGSDPAPSGGEWGDSGFEAAGEGPPMPEPFSDEDIERFSRLASGFGMAWTILSVVFGYFIAAFCFQKIMEKTGKKDLALVAWIPVVNWVAVPWLISGRPLMFLILVYVVPCLGLFFYIAMWYDVCVARNKNGVWAFVAVFIPVLGVPYLAFSE